MAGIDGPAARSGTIDWDGDNYGFADGHVQWIARKKLPDGTWAKEPDNDSVTWKPELKGDTGKARPAP